MKKIQNNFIKIAYNLAKINLGKTNKNPSVGCILVKNNSVISSGITSINGRPHAEFNALKNNKNLTNSDLYVTMEPCTHYGVTPPCTNLVIKKNIKKVFFSNYDLDKRTMNKAKFLLRKKNIVAKKVVNKDFKDFYQSYFLLKKDLRPLIDAKIAISGDYFTIYKKKWITNFYSRKRAHLIRSEYDAILSTSKSINSDNSKLNCRLPGFNSNKPDLIIIDLNKKLKQTLNLFKNKKRKIIIITKKKEYRKTTFLKNKKVKLVYVDSLKNSRDFLDLFKKIGKLGYQRILVESGLIFINSLLKLKFISNLYVFKGSIKLGKKGKNNASINSIKKFKLKKKMKVNLYGDKIYKIKIR